MGTRRGWGEDGIFFEHAGPCRDCVAGSSTTPWASSLACDGQPASETSQATLETLHEFGGDRRLAFGVTTGRFAARFLGFCDAKRGIEQLVGIR